VGAVYQTDFSIHESITKIGQTGFSSKIVEAIDVAKRAEHGFSSKVADDKRAEHGE